MALIIKHPVSNIRKKPCDVLATSTIEKITAIAAKIRKEMEISFDGDLAGHCIEASDKIVQDLATQLGIEAKATEGWCLYDDECYGSDHPWDPHTWVEIPALNLYVDVTADQFNYGMALENEFPNIIVCDGLPYGMQYNEPTWKDFGFEEYNEDTVFYHVTLSDNIPSIREQGLLPQLGERSLEVGELDPAVFLFASEEDVYNALSNWLGEWYDVHYGEDCKLEVLCIHPSPDMELFYSDAEYEKICKSIIPPDCIFFIDEYGKEVPISKKATLDHLIHSASLRVAESQSIDKSPVKDTMPER